jgi:hypothetical protein
LFATDGLLEAPLARSSMSREQLTRALQDICNRSMSGARVVSDSTGHSVAVYDAPGWSSAHTDALRTRYGGTVSVEVQQCQHSASGFVVVVSTLPRFQAPACAMLVAGCVVVVLAGAVFWNMLHVHFEGAHNIDIFACPAPETVPTEPQAL